MASASSFCLQIPASSTASVLSSSAHSSISTPMFSTRRLLLSAIHPSSQENESQMHGGIQQKLKDFRSRRRIATASTLAALSLMFAVGVGDAQARDIPIFGIRKVQKLEEEVVKEVKELVKEGVSETKASVEAAEEAVKETMANLSSLSSSKPASALSPTLQAGIVAGAEVVAFLVASSVVENLVSKPSK